MNEDFSLGKMSADARLTATFKCYEKTEQNGKIVISEDIEEYRWDIEKDTEYWDFSTNILGNFTFDVHTMRKDLESLYRDTLVILMFKKCLERLDVSTDLAQITWTN